MMSEWGRCRCKVNRAGCLSLLAHYKGVANGYALKVLAGAIATSALCICTGARSCGCTAEQG